MSPQSTLDHVLRPVPPWRPNDRTECGLNAADHRIITREEFNTRVKNQGQQRAAMSICMTCWSTARRWKSWELNPRDVIARDVNRYGPEADDELNQELRAIAALIAAHEGEFRSYLDGLADTVSLDQARRSRQHDLFRSRTQDIYD